MNPSILVPLFCLVAAPLLWAETEPRDLFDATNARKIIEKPLLPAEVDYATYLSLSTESGAEIPIKPSNAIYPYYLHRISAEGRITGSPFGLRAAILFVPDPGLSIGARLYFPGPSGPFFGMQGDLLFNPRYPLRLYGTAGFSAGWRFVLDGRDYRGGSFFFEPLISLDGDIVDFALWDPAASNRNGFFVRDFRPSLTLGFGYLFH